MVLASDHNAYRILFYISRHGLILTTSSWLSFSVICLSPVIIHVLGCTTQMHILSLCLQDRYIFWGGILITVTIMALILWYLL